jgi:hypothetical protein
LIIGFGFGSPLVALLMLIATSLLSYSLWRMWRSNKFDRRSEEEKREELRRYYYEQRELARRLSREFDLSDEEIERRIDEELRKD